MTTLALYVVNLASMHGQPSIPFAPFHYLPPLLLAGAVVAPLPLAARYPLLAWRIGWLALLLAPLVPGEWRGGWPWGGRSCSCCW